TTAAAATRGAPQDKPDAPEKRAPKIVSRPPSQVGADQARPAGPAAAPALHVQRVPLSRMRMSIARRMAESKREAPHFYLTTVVGMDEAVRLRASLKELEQAAGVTYNHMILRATAQSLLAFPEMNARFAGEAIEIL